MGSFLNIVFALVLVQQVLAYQPRKICPANEVYNECGSACPLTCGNYKDGLQMCTGQCVPGCECAEGYVRNEADNKCCLESECPETEHVCPANEIFNECGTACPLTCDNYKDPPEFCTMQCVIGCQCAPGYVRNEADGTCCLESECPETEVVCSANEVFTECGTACPLSCDNYKNPPEFCTEQCVVGCQCAPGYVRNEADGSCCLESECPAETEQVCPANEKYNACGTACPLTCDNYKAGILMCTDQCVPGCECAEGYVRNEADGSCCLESECPDTEQVCPANEVYNECGTACPITCDNYKDGPQVCTRQCVPGCECAEGYVRNEADGKCCLESECPETEQVCPANEIYTECGTACPLTCDNYENPPEFCTMQCVIGCQCAPGYVRNEADGTCCLESECPAKHVCPANEVYNGCGTACPATCNNYKNGPRACTLQCVPGCECVEGYVRNEADGTCCLESECPEIDVICPANEVFNECGSACPFTCDNYKNPPKFCTMQCVIGCQCAPGYVRNEANGKCCLASECPGEQICPANEVFNECGSACPLTCDNYKNPPRFCTKQCVIGCQCAPGYVRNEADGKCCLKSQCPAPHPVCPLNEEYNTCGTACPDTCDNYKNKSRVCTKQCVIGCQCKKGYVRRSDGVCCLPAECVHIKPSECGCSKKVSDCGCSNKTSDCGCSKKPSLLSAILGLLF